MNGDDLTEKAMPTGTTTGSPPPAAAESPFEHPAAPPPLAALLDVAAVDTYLLQTFVAPKFASLLRQLLKITTSSSSSATATNQPRDKYERVIQLMSLPLVQIVTLLHTRGQTPAVRMLGLKLTVPSLLPSDTSKNNKHVPPALQWNIGQFASCGRPLLLYAWLRFIVPVLYQLFRDWLVARQNKLTILLLQQQQYAVNDDVGSENQQQQERTALLRQCRIAQTIVIASDRMWPVVQLIALLSCWRRSSATSSSSSRTTTIIATPDVALRLAGLTYQNRSSRKITTHAALPPPPLLLHVTYAHRRWLYQHGFATVQQFTAGLFTARAVWFPIVRDTFIDPVVRFWRNQTRTTTTTTTTTSAVLVCPICRHDISTATTMAVRADCSCGQVVYCYTCLYDAAAAAPQRWYRCYQCGQHIGTATAV